MGGVGPSVRTKPYKAVLSNPITLTPLHRFSSHLPPNFLVFSHNRLTSVMERYAWGCLAACRSKANKQARLVEMKVWFQMLATGGEVGRHLSKGQLTPTPVTLDKQGVRAFIDRVGRWWGKVPWGNSTVISNSHLKLVTSGLTNIILVVLGSVNLWFQGALIPISLHSVLGIVAAQVLGTVWSSCS